jgi:hypothetical protein
MLWRGVPSVDEQGRSSRSGRDSKCACPEPGDRGDYGSCHGGVAAKASPLVPAAAPLLTLGSSRLVLFLVMRLVRGDHFIGDFLGNEIVL